MARATIQLISLIQKTANILESSSDYQWGHMGTCNCGFLAQQITHLQKDEIHRRAMCGYGDWNEQLNDYCPASGLPMDNLISEMLNFGFDSDDLKHLERLSDKKILQALPPEERFLTHNNKTDVVKYMRIWANLLETELLDEIRLPNFSVPQSIL